MAWLPDLPFERVLAQAHRVASLLAEPEDDTRRQSRAGDPEKTPGRRQARVQRRRQAEVVAWRAGMREVRRGDGRRDGRDTDGGSSPAIARNDNRPHDHDDGDPEDDVQLWALDGRRNQGDACQERRGGHHHGGLESLEESDAPRSPARE
jgi:hypothetical protein